ncbi:MAG TPA: TAXI family TRAP transporter solute-binding subunit [Rhodanobacteraceae bacterium]
MSDPHQDAPAPPPPVEPPPHSNGATSRHFLARLKRLPRISWRDLLVSLGPIAVIVALAVFLIFRFMQPPPRTLTISSGPVGSIFYMTAKKYQPILARNGITLKVLPSEGSLQNLQRLASPDSGVDIALVQGGVTDGGDTHGIVSLGSLFYEPIALFYRGKQPLTRLSQLRGRYIGIGAVGSGTRFLAVALLKANGIDVADNDHLKDIEGNAAMQALLDQKVGAIFLSGDSATPANFRTLLLAPGIHMFNFTQADAYVRRFRYLSQLKIPAGTFDLGQDLPHQPLHLLAPTVELLAHSDLHPALVDLLIQAARQVNGRGNVLQKPGEFPAPLQHTWPIDSEAQRFYKSGETFLYRYLPFWLASLLGRTWFVVVPFVVVFVPAVELAPILYGWIVKGRIYRRYGNLMALERAALDPLTPEQRAQLVVRLDDIEKDIIGLKMPGAYASEVYVLRQHVKFVRAQLAGLRAT